MSDEFSGVWRLSRHILVVWLLMLLAWYLVGLPIGQGIYPRLS